jgi:hypothetical protein
LRVEHGSLVQVHCCLENEAEIVKVRPQSRSEILYRGIKRSIVIGRRKEEQGSSIASASRLNSEFIPKVKREVFVPFYFSILSLLVVDKIPVLLFAI